MEIMSRRKTRFRERSRVQQVWLLGLTAASVALVTAAERDIQRRPEDQMRGSKLGWRVLSLNALGSLGYFVWGRRPAGRTITPG